MFKITKKSDNWLEFEFEGTLDADGMRTALDEMVEKSKGVRNGRISYWIGDFSMPTLGAVAVELSRLPQLFGLLAKYDKCAVRSDKEWIRKWAEIEGALIPGMEIKSFTPDEREAADAWLAQD